MESNGTEYKDAIKQKSKIKSQFLKNANKTECLIANKRREKAP